VTVHLIDAAGVVLDPKLPRSGSRHVDVFVSQNLRPADFMHAYCTTIFLSRESVRIVCGGKPRKYPVLLRQTGRTRYVRCLSGYPAIGQQRGRDGQSR
jgi:hypothetical protein